MPIRMMTSKDRAHLPNVEFVPHYSMDTDVDYVRHSYDCPHSQQSYGHITKERYPDCPPTCKNHEGLYMETTFVGCVISTRERNGYDDSDFYATVWNEEKQAPESIEYATTRGWTYPNSAIVDATPEVLAKYRAYRIESGTKQAVQDDIELSAKPSAGKVCRVFKGRKYPKGLVVTVRDTYETCYGVGRWATKTTMAKFNYHHADGRFDIGATNVENLEVIDPAKHRRSEAEIRASIVALIDDGGSYVSPFFVEAMKRIGRW